MTFLKKGISQNNNAQETNQETNHIDYFTTSIVYIIACMMMADGKATKNELSAVKKFLLKALGETEARIALLMLRDYLGDIDMNVAQDIRLCCLRLNQRWTYDERLSFLSTLFQIAVADGMICNEEAKLVQKYAKFTGIRSQDFTRMKNYYTYGYKWQKDQDNRSKYKQRQSENDSTDNQSSTQGTNGKSWAYKALGLPNNASKEEIKKAYRKLAQQYHPDKQIGASEEEIKQATEKFKEITLAYETLTEGGK